MIQCCQPAVAITVSYKPSVQQVQTSEQRHIFHYTLLHWLAESLKGLFKRLMLGPYKLIVNYWIALLFTRWRRSFSNNFRAMIEIGKCILFICHSGNYICKDKSTNSRGVHPTLRPWCISPLFQINPIFHKKFRTFWKILTILPFPEQFSDFHPPKFLMTFF